MSAEAAADVAAVESVNQEFYAAFEHADLDRMSAVWGTDENGYEIGCVHPGWPLLRGRSEVLRSWALIMANTPYIQFVLTDVQVRVFGDVAVLTCAENILTAGEAGESSFAAGGRVVSTNTFTRTPDGWRLWLHHGSPVLQGEVDEDEES
ncbi:nuclear transport factor 2 family protein [Rhizohabitans arisaemae]|uniref:nuclear transport factor 2 family protein n=1 Tax=Rhizohabitans arisaemae TaxID=2720610 RepID=UPI0024B055D9|nr:nuclear transport factor 2 family protein [Rhizohabitans arisaemae]